MEAGPDVLNHNIETVPRLYKRARPQGVYERSLELLQRVRHGWPRVYSKSGLMVGLGENDAELLEVLADLRRHQVDIVTIGQYLSPGPKHLPVDRFVTPEQFASFKQHGEEELGFLQVVSTPLTRSSYHASEVQRLMQDYPRSLTLGVELRGSRERPSSGTLIPAASPDPLTQLFSSHLPPAKAKGNSASHGDRTEQQTEGEVDDAGRHADLLQCHRSGEDNNGNPARTSE